MKIEKRYTTTQAAKLLGLSPSTVLRAVNDKKLKAQVTPGGHFRITRSAVMDFQKKLTLGS